MAIAVLWTCAEGRRLYAHDADATCVRHEIRPPGGATAGRPERNAGRRASPCVSLLPTTGWIRAPRSRAHRPWSARTTPPPCQAGWSLRHPLNRTPQTCASPHRPRYKHGKKKKNLPPKIRDRFLPPGGTPTNERSTLTERAQCRSTSRARCGARYRRCGTARSSRGAARSARPCKRAPRARRPERCVPQ